MFENSSADNWQKGLLKQTLIRKSSSSTTTSSATTLSATTTIATTKANCSKWLQRQTRRPKHTIKNLYFWQQKKQKTKTTELDEF